ncbi:hypothetical protein BDW75DRAFT_241697 [Aspergillus navahoensis]
MASHVRDAEKTANGQLCASVAADSPGKLQCTLYADVAYFDRASSSTTEEWKLWLKRTLRGQSPDERWTPGGREGDPNEPVFGRLARYPEAVPRSEGIDETVSWESSGRTLSCHFKRNFTFALAYATCLSDTPDQWGSIALNNFEKGTATSTTVSHVFCAVNLINQPDVYRCGSYNGYCFDTSKGQNGMLPSGCMLFFFFKFF